jgi:hypothetical protein
MGERDGGDGAEVRDLLLTADAAESALLARFTGHGLFASLDSLDDAAFFEVLLQRRFLSLAFPVVYDLAIDGLTDPAAVRLVREILREEYPDATGATPSHREDLVADLLVLGATRAQIVAARPSGATAVVLEQTLALMLDATAAGGDLAVLTILRFWGEVLVSVEYGEFWRRMQPRFAAAGADSRFYHPHHHHDGREPLARASEGSATHSGRLGACVARLFEGGAAADEFERVEERVLATRLAFYDQFTSPA